jgi:pyruvyl transferase EpsO
MNQSDLDHTTLNHPVVNHALLMGALASQHDILLDLIGNRPLHYVDLPVHGNIGDLLIMHGTLAFFHHNHIVPKVSAPAFAYEPDWIRAEDTIVFHGGGNFGDLYAEFGMQGLREDIVNTYRDNRVIVLPQTLYFSSDEAMQQSAAIFRRHPDVHLCVRDKVSYDIALHFTDNVYLLPDMAHQLYRVKAAHANPHGALRISRTDDEKAAATVIPGLDIVATTDWPMVVGDGEQRIDLFRRGMRGMHKYGLGWYGNKLLMGLWADYSRRLVNQAAALFAAHEHVVTDRLHGHILACLMDKPNTVLDNSYGKNSTYVNAWTGSSELVTLQQA